MVLESAGGLFGDKTHLAPGSITFQDQFDEVIEAKRGAHTTTNIEFFSSSSESALAGNGAWQDVVNSSYTVTAADIVSFKKLSGLATLGVFYAFQAKCSFASNGYVRLLVDGTARETTAQLGTSYASYSLSWSGAVTVGMVVKLQQTYPNNSHTITVKDRVLKAGMSFDKDMSGLNNYFAERILVAASATVVLNDATTYSYGVETVVSFPQPIKVLKAVYEADCIIYFMREKG